MSSTTCEQLRPAASTIMSQPSENASSGDSFGSVIPRFLTTPHTLSHPPLNSTFSPRGRRRNDCDSAVYTSWYTASIASFFPLQSEDEER